MKYKGNTTWSFGVTNTGEIIFCETFVPDFSQGPDPDTSNIIVFNPRPKLKLLNFMKGCLKR